MRKLELKVKRLEDALDEPYKPIEFCKHPEIFCPNGYSLVDYTDGGAYCCVCDTGHISTDVAKCSDECGCAFETNDNSPTMSELFGSDSDDDEDFYGSGSDDDEGF